VKVDPRAPMSEADLDRAVRMLAETCGWERFHVWNSRHSASGFPDLVLCRPPRLAFAELKSQNGKLTVDQQRWLDFLRSVPSIEVYVWRPDDLDHIARILSPRHRDRPP